MGVDQVLTLDSCAINLFLRTNGTYFSRGSVRFSQLGFLGPKDLARR
jgi:hypothetical protein